MAKVRYKANRSAARQVLFSPRVITDVNRRTRAVAQESNRQSSWGGYKYETDVSGNRPRGRVWSFGKSDRPGGDRALRMISNLDAGR